MNHQQAMSLLGTIQHALDQLQNVRTLRSTRAIHTMMLIDEKLSKLLHSNVATALDERDSLEIKF